MDLVYVVRCAVKIICLILFALIAVVSYREKKSGNYLEAIYDLGLATILYVAAATT